MERKLKTLMSRVQGWILLDRGTPDLNADLLPNSNKPGVSTLKHPARVEVKALCLIEN
ncbi:hypothetical protein [Yoonia sp. R2-816]|uniref:hypothetical protein n=1 Tax=Yoonia sp. R2-816 TaxID=3342638 RepID=UPI00372781EB